MRKSALEQLIHLTGDADGVSFIFLMAWLGASDGNLDTRERSAISGLVKRAFSSSEYLEDIFSMALQGRTADITCAARYLRRNANNPNREAILQMTIGIALVDGVMSVGENHIIRFISDCLEISHKQLKECFSEITGKPLPDPGDVSSRNWWDSRNTTQRTNQNRQSKSEWRQRNDDAPKNDDRKLTRSEAFSRLGLQEGATSAEVKIAYKRLAKAHHPDRFADLDQTVIDVASESFRRIREAYELLTK